MSTASTDPSEHEVTSWSHQYRCNGSTVPLGNSRDWTGLLAKARKQGRAVALRGAGLSWTDITMAEHGLTGATTAHDRILGFDPATGRLHAQAGATLARILGHTLPHGWTLHCLPGSLQVTLGGAIACNVHGKDSHHHGTFFEQVCALDLFDATGRHHILRRSDGEAMIDAVAGSMGLLGLIGTATLQLARLPGHNLRHERHDVRGAGALARFALQHRNRDFVWGWLDPFRAMRGEVMALANTCTWTREGPPPLPFPIAPHGNIMLWKLLAGGLTAGRAQAVTALTHRLARQRSQVQVPVKPWHQILFPHARLGGLNELFSKRGFVEIQAIVPDDSLAVLFGALGNLAREERLRAFLVSFKLHRASSGMLAFSGDGIGLSFVTTVFDQPPETLARGLAALRHVLADAGGRINLHRDGTMPLACARRMYPQLSCFMEHKRRLDPDNLLRPAFWDRLTGESCAD